LVDSIFGILQRGVRRQTTVDCVGNNFKAYWSSSSPSNMREIIGGDFNAPIPDKIFKLMKGFQDAFHESGTGWGNTALNSLPIARPDQIWLKGLHSKSTRAIRTQNSDHRLVVAEIELGR